MWTVNLVLGKREKKERRFVAGYVLEAWQG